MTVRVRVRVGSIGLVVLAAFSTSGALSPVSLLGDGSPRVRAGEGLSGITVPGVTAGEPLVGDASDVGQVRGPPTGGPQRFAVPCRADHTGQLVVEVARPAAATASMQGVTVSYEVAGEAVPLTVALGMAVTLCGPQDMEGMFCAQGSRPEP